jgi:zinc protease
MEAIRDMNIERPDELRRVHAKTNLQQPRGLLKSPVIFTTNQGLKVVVVETHFAPVVTIQSFVRVGSADETPKTYGAAHFFEHLIFKGTKRRGVGAIASEVEAAGGNINAYTSFDQTVFYLTMKSDHFKQGVDILGDAMTNHQIAAIELEREREVVIEEIRRGRDLPGRRSGEILFQTVFKQHPYGRPVIGFERTLEKMRIPDIRGFYNNYYTAKNMTVVIVGDVDAAKAFKEVSKAFRFRQTGAPLRPKRVVEPPMRSPRITAAGMKVNEVYVNVGFHIPDVTHEDIPALDVLSSIMGGDETSVLHRHCILEKTVANSVYAQCYTPRDPGVFIIGGTFPRPIVRDGITTLAEAFRLLLDGPPSEDDLKRVQDHLMAERVYEKETVEGLARMVGFYDFYFNDLRAEARYISAVQDLTPAHLHDVATKYLDKPGFAASVLCHTEDDRRVLVNHVKEQFSRNTKKAPTKPLSQGAEKADPHVETLSHAGGNIRLVIQKLGHLPIMSLRWVQGGGLRCESPAKGGIAQLFSQVWSRGSQRFSNTEILRSMKSLGGSVASFAGKNTVGIGLDILARNSEHGLEVFEDVFLNPTFAQEEFEREKLLLLEEIRTSDDHLSHVVSRLFMKTLYPQHPYGRTMHGDASSVGALTRADLSQYYEEFVRPQGSVLSVVGDVDVEAVKARVRSWLTNAHKGAPAKVTPRLEATPTSRRVAVDERPHTNQAHILLGFMGTTLTSPDRHAFKLIASLLSGQGGRLFLDLRDKQSLAYSVTSLHSEGIDPGYFAFYIACAPEKINVALAGIRKHIKMLQDKPASKSELARAKAYLLGHQATDLQHHSTRAMTLALDEYYGNGVLETLHMERFVNPVQAKDLQRVAQKYFREDGEVLAVVCPPQFRHLVS